MAQRLHTLLSRAARPTALIVANNRVGVAAPRLIRELGPRIPSDIAVAAFDDLELFSLRGPPITALARRRSSCCSSEYDLPGRHPRWLP